ncbi:MAG: thiamine-phosphate kinase [Gemmatimonadales bacterium]
MSALGLGVGREFDRLRAIFARLDGATLPGDSLGDDCALIRLGGTTLAASIDSSLEGLHFRTDWLDFAEIGFRAAGAALSDLAADGADPLGLLVSLGVPNHPGADQKGKSDPAAQIMAGVAQMAQSVNAAVLGGDLVLADRYLIDVCVLGIAQHPVRRAGAREGDGLWVTGYLGGAGLALAMLRAGKRPPTALRNRYACPEPRLRSGRWLAAHGATAMIDISDGLAADAAHLAAASEIGLEINLEQLPRWEGVDALAAAASGEEFELLLTLPPHFGEANVSTFRAETGVQLTRIGVCLREAGGRRGGVRLLQGNTQVSVPPGYDHFAQ